MCVIQNVYIIKEANLLVIALNEIHIKSMYTFDFTSLILLIIVNNLIWSFKSYVDFKSSSPLRSSLMHSVMNTNLKTTDIIQGTFLK